MQKSLSSIFKAITPENIQRIDFISTSMDIFTNVLEELCQESIDVKNLYKNEKFREELIKTYMADLYNVITDLKNNEIIAAKIKTINNTIPNNPVYDPDVIYNLVDYIKDEHFLTIKQFNQKKGTIKAIEYMYRLISELIAPSIKQYINITEGEPFNYDVEGSLASEFYEYLVKPLAHPVGFVYTYTQLMIESLVDYYSNITSFDVSVLEVRTLYPDGSTEVVDYLDGRVVSDIQTSEENNITTLIVLFEDGTYLKQETDSNSQTTVWYMDSDDSVLIQYQDQSSIFINYEIVYEVMPLETEFSHEGGKLAGDYFARLDYRKTTVKIGDLSIYGSPYIGQTAENGFYIGDRAIWCTRGYNSDLSREEHYFKPTSTEDIAAIGKTGVISELEYEQENVGNEEYVAHENLEFGVYRNDVLLEDNNYAAYSI